MRDWRSRVVGGVFLLGSVGSTLVHRHVYEAARGGPARLAELALAAGTLIFGMVGVLLVQHGSRLFARDRPQSRRAAPPASTSRHRQFTVDSLLASGSPEAVLLDSRRGVAMVLASRANAVAAERRSARSNTGMWSGRAVAIDELGLATGARRRARPVRSPGKL